MDNEKKIEIPFGAFDSELIHQEINIPNGFKAVIDENKIILTRIENEDEKIRKALVKAVSGTLKGTKLFGTNVTRDEALAWLEKQGEQKPNPYSGTSFEYNGHTWGMCARDNGVDILCDKHLIGHLDKQGETYTKRDVDDAWLKGMCDAKRELEKQSDSPIKWNKNTKDCKPKVKHNVLMKTTHGIAEGEWQGEQWLQYRWSGLVRDIDVLSWIELSDLEKRTYEQ